MELMEINSRLRLQGFQSEEETQFIFSTPNRGGTIVRGKGSSNCSSSPPQHPPPPPFSSLVHPPPSPLLCAVSNVILLTPAVCVCVGKSCWVHVTPPPIPPTPPAPHWPLLTPRLACRPALPYALQVSCHCRSQTSDTLDRQE